MSETKYTVLELFFANKYKWVRKRSKAIWMRGRIMWLKISEEEYRFFKHNKDYQFEDWRK